MTSEFAAAAARLAAEHDAAFAALKLANKVGPTGRDLEAFTEAMDRHSATEESLRKEFFPRWARLMIGGGMACVTTAKMRRSEIVWRAPKPVARIEWYDAWDQWAVECDECDETWMFSNEAEAEKLLPLHRHLRVPT